MEVLQHFHYSDFFFFFTYFLIKKLKLGYYIKKQKQIVKILKGAGDFSYTSPIQLLSAVPRNNPRMMSFQELLDKNYEI